jgi:hypothetical protein
MIDNKELTEMVKGTPPLCNFLPERMEKGLEKCRKKLLTLYLSPPVFILLTPEESTSNIGERCFRDLSPFSTGTHLTL